MRLLQISRSEDFRYQVIKTTEVFFLTKTIFFFFNFIFKEHSPLHFRSIRPFFYWFFFLSFLFFNHFVIALENVLLLPRYGVVLQLSWKGFHIFLTRFFFLLLCAKCGIRGAQKPPEAFCLWKTMSRHFRLLYTMNRFNIRRASNF